MPLTLSWLSKIFSLRSTVCTLTRPFKPTLPRLDQLRAKLLVLLLSQMMKSQAKLVNAVNDELKWEILVHMPQLQWAFYFEMSGLLGILLWFL